MGIFLVLFAMEILTKKIEFPDHSKVSTHGIIAIGGDLSTERLKLAYKKGIFPWFNPNEPILWWFPDPRFVLFPNRLRVSKSMKQIFKKNIFTITENLNFEAVIHNCQNTYRPGQDGTWISDEMKEAYIELHKLGLAKSVEIWQNDELVGGFYGIDQGNIFCGESMFSKVSNASKAGFIWFVEKYKNKYELIDCQVHSNHLESLGAENIPAKEFLKYLN